MSTEKPSENLGGWFQTRRFQGAIRSGGSFADVGASCGGDRCWHCWPSSAPAPSPDFTSAPVAAVGVSLLVPRGSFGWVEHVPLALSAVFVAYILSGFLAHPDWGATAKGLVVPKIPLNREAILVSVAVAAPWGLAFIQSYTVDKQLRIEDLRYERIDVATGAVLSGVIGLLIVVACAATLHVEGITTHDAGDAAPDPGTAGRSIA